MRQLTVFLLMLTLSLAASAKLYKWVDADGNFLDDSARQAQLAKT